MAPVVATTTLDLGGPWEFCPAPDYQPGALQATGDCYPLEIPNGWEQAVPKYDGFGLLRRNFSSAQVPSSDTLGLYFWQLRDADKTYLNGRLIGQTGQFPPQFEKATLYSRLYRIDPDWLATDGDNQLLIWVYNNARPGGIYDQPPLLGDYFVLRQRIEADNYRTLIFITALLTFALLHLIYFAFRRRSRENLVYAVFLVAWAIYMWTYSAFAQHSGIHMSLLFRLNVALFFTIFAIFPVFLHVFFERPVPLLLKGVIGLVLLNAVFVMLVPNIDLVYTSLLVVETVGVVLVLPFVLYLGYRAISDQRPYARVFSLVLLLYIAVGLIDILLDLTQLAFPFVRSLLGPYALLVLSTTLTFILSHKHWGYYREATFDPLTGAMRRSAFLSRLDQLMLRARRGDGRLVVAMMDLDNFKEVNDRHGHLAGDAILVAASKRMRAVLPKDDYVGRFGGDEFCVASIVTVSHEPKRFVSELHQVMGDIQVDWQALRLSAKVTTGAVLYDPRAHTDAAALIGAADQLLIEAKANRKGSMAWQPLVLNG